MKYTIITLVKDDDVYENCLLSSLRKHFQNYDILPLFNYQNNYNLDNLLRIAQTSSNSEYIVIAHQDTSVKKQTFQKLQKAVKGNIPIVGCAGIKLTCECKDVNEFGGFITEPKTVGNVSTSEDAQPYWAGSEDLTEVHSVDECFLAIRRDLLKDLKLIYNSYHLYASDISLQIRSKGLKIYAADLDIIHHTDHNRSIKDDHNYWNMLRYLNDKYHAMFPEFFGTCFHWQHRKITSYIGFELQASKDQMIKANSIILEL